MQTPCGSSRISGLTAVWAGANTREEIFASLRRRETYATSGPRITVRFFGSFSYTADVLEQIDWIERAYRHGTSMGGVIEGRDAEAEPGEGSAPKFIVWAARDPRGANLDRVQIVLPAAR